VPKVTPTPTPIFAPWLNPEDLFAAGDVVPGVLLTPIIEVTGLEVVVGDVVAAPGKI
jgi:hypothetical protein